MRNAWRGVLVMMIALMLTNPAAADVRRDGHRDVFKLAKTWLAQMFGDGLSDPRP